MKTKLTLRIGMLVMTAAFTALACTLPAALQKNAPEIAGTATQPVGAATQPASDGAPSGKLLTGKAVLPDPSVGLDDLKTYHASIQVQTVGKLDGQPFERHTQVEITRASTGDFDNQIRLASSGRFVRLVSLDGAYYRWSGEKAACQGSVDPPIEDEVVEPAALMLPVGSASRVGVETVGEVSSVHYRFDTTGLAQFKTTGPINGDFWIAENGAYVVKYVLKAGAPENPPANGLEVVQTYTYELTPGGEALGLPKGCTVVPVDLPLITGAQNVARTGGLVSYQTRSTPRAVFDFYSQKLADLGWESEIAAPTGEIKLPYFIHYTRDRLRLTLSLSANEDDSLGVEMMLVDLVAAQPGAAPQPTPTSAGTPTPEPTANPADSGLPAGVPLYPGAAGLMKASGAVIFTAADPWKNVAAYYKDQMTANGWSITDEYSLEDGVTQMWKKDGAMISMLIVADAGKTRVIVTKAD
jgi:hypothetical protein